MNDLVLGANVSTRYVTFVVRAPAAERVELCLYFEAMGAEPVLRQAMQSDNVGMFTLRLAASAVIGRGAIYWGYRAFGPNWHFDPAWTPGTEHGFQADVDRDGNRFNPNKLLLDPFAREISHCVQSPAQPQRSPYMSGPASRTIDTGPFAPKGVLFTPPESDFGTKPTHPFKDEIIYEVHVRGLTMADVDVPESLRGTYAGAALRAPYLRDLGVTAVEFLPVHQTQNALNDDLTFPGSHNYWGYQSMGFFAPDRRHAADQSPGGPTREFIAMVKAFHDVGLKVVLDVVYNHTEEGGVGETPEARTIYTFRGLDNAHYYETERGRGRPQDYEDNNGVGPNFNAAEPMVRDLVMDSLAYFADQLGVDGFRFDLAAVLGNANSDGGFRFDRDDPQNILNRAVRELPVRAAGGGAGVDLIAEPYAVSMNAQEQGNFPHGWAEWNDRFRDTMRAAQNKLGIIPITPGQIAMRIAGSQDLYGANARGPWTSVNYIVCHDGFCLVDLHSFDERRNHQDWPLGPSDGGRSSADEMGWDHGGSLAMQQQATRTSLALLLMSAGVPMIAGGCEIGRTQHGNNNAYNIDNRANWIDWTLAQANAGQLSFARSLIAFRRAHAALRPAVFYTGLPQNGNKLKDLTWLRDDGNEIDDGYFSDPTKHFIAWQLDAGQEDDATRIYIAYNGWIEAVEAQLPTLESGEAWFVAFDTSAAEGSDSETPITGQTLVVAGRSMLAAVAWPIH